MLIPPAFTYQDWRRWIHNSECSHISRRETLPADIDVVTVIAPHDDFSAFIVPNFAASFPTVQRWHSALLPSALISGGQEGCLILLSLNGTVDGIFFSSFWVLGMALVGIFFLLFLVLRMALIISEPHLDCIPLHRIYTCSHQINPMVIKCSFMFKFSE